MGGFQGAPRRANTEPIPQNAVDLVRVNLDYTGAGTDASRFTAWYPRKLATDVEPYSAASNPLGGLPGIILIHGGGWATGDEYNLEASDFSGNMPAFFASMGFVVGNTNYPLSLLGGAVNPYPTAMNALALMVTYFRSTLAVRATWNALGNGLPFPSLNPNLLIIAGGSAGANMSWLYGSLASRTFVKGTYSWSTPATLQVDMGPVTSGPYAGQCPTIPPVTPTELAIFAAWTAERNFFQLTIANYLQVFNYSGTGCGALSTATFDAASPNSAVNLAAASLTRRYHAWQSIGDTLPYSQASAWWTAMTGAGLTNLFAYTNHNPIGQPQHADYPPTEAGNVYGYAAGVRMRQVYADEMYRDLALGVG